MGQHLAAARRAVIDGRRHGTGDVLAGHVTPRVVEHARVHTDHRVARTLYIGE